ncbi:hemerythrin domain-containing protein [Brevundimonas variabilis]|uniref:Hemerythrin-like domain-containing protein n=1 Tax=Brevundimonas variabilis TaxID=74312 RepID=A0A7W9CI92_9CAUL|nr:hemerythrin domain-containing protein [Brevundimonas variabilis]MBB5746122.1 hypothetical protein [Brevundimonas variabilis]
MIIRTLRAQHRVLLDRASELAGLAGRVRVQDDALEADHIIGGMNALLVRHLQIEDEWLYPTLMKASEENLRTFATDSFEEMGGVLGAWQAYRREWSAETIHAHPERFARATRGIVEALALRVEREEDHLYPAMDSLMATQTEPDRTSAVA